MVETRIIPALDILIPFLEEVRAYVRPELLAETDALLQQLYEVRAGEQRLTLQQVVEVMHTANRISRLSRPQEVSEEQWRQGPADPFRLLDTLVLLQSIYAIQPVTQPEEEETFIQTNEAPSPLEEEIAHWLDRQQDFVSFSTPSGWIIASCDRHPEHTRMQACLRHLYTRFSDDLGRLAADLYFAPQRWLSRYDERPTYSVNMASILNACVVTHAPSDILERIETRVTNIRNYAADPANYAGDRAEMVNVLLEPPRAWIADRMMDLIISLFHPSPLTGRLQQFSSLRIWSTWMPGSVQACLNVLLGLPVTAHSCALIERLRGGDYKERDIQYGGCRHYAFFSLVYTDITDMLIQLFRYGTIPYDIYQRSALLLPTLLLNTRGCQQIAQQVSEQERDRFLHHMEGLCRRFILDTASNLTAHNSYVITAIGLDTPLPPPGSDYFLLAAQCYEQLNLGPLKIQSYTYQSTIQNAIIRLAQANDIEPGTPEGRQQFLTRLRQYSVQTLKSLLPFALSEGYYILCEALGWERIYPLLDYLKKRAEQPFHSDEDTTESTPADLSTDSQSTVDVAEVRALLAQAGLEGAREALELFYEAHVMRDTCTLLMAVAGWNRTRLEKSLKHNSQIALEAYGLLPIERGEEEVLERYLVLQEKVKTATKFGPQRRVSHKAAALVGLRNLAYVAGYPDASLLELAMEAKLSQEVAPHGRTWQIDDYTLTLCIEGVEVSLAIGRNGSTLKTIPPTIRKSPVYKEAQETVRLLRSQVSRLRSTLLEKLIVSGDALSLEHFKILARLPVGQALLERLILETTDGHRGLFAAEAFALRQLDGSLHPISSAVRIVHPYTLFQAGALTDWQREIVHWRIVQPIKQAFRELYLLTPAERTTGSYSLRFAGHAIDGRIASRLFTARQWRFESDYRLVVPYKPFPGMRAVFSLTGTGHYMGEAGTITTDQIFFERYPWHTNGDESPDERKIALEEVPPLILSEVMRDADLVVSVAGVRQDGVVALSNEAYAKRGELLTTLLAELDLAGVTVEGHFAHVQGKLARYRVHLGSAAIHIEPGAYLCVVPAGWGTTHERLFLPYANEGDDKISEVISKIFLLLADDRIKDETILRQIRAHT